MARRGLRVMAAVAVLAGAWGWGLAQSQGQGEGLSSRRADFRGRLLVVACDTDMLPSAYADGKLGPAVGPDVLSVIRLDHGLAQAHVATAEVTNSVTGPPAAVAVTPDGRYALVAETQGVRPAGRPEATMKDLAPGRKLTVVSLEDPDRPRVVQQIDSYERAVSIAINAAGTLVAVTYAPALHTAVPLVLFHFRDGRLVDPVEPKVPGFGPEDELRDAEFLPGREVLGLVFSSDGYASKARPRLVLVTYAEAKKEMTLAPWGNEVPTDPSPYLVKFTADGRFAVVNSMHLFPDGRGTVTSIALASGKDAAKEPEHAIVSRVAAGKFPEGLAISPDGRWAATANLENSYLPIGDPDQQFFGSLSLLRMDPASGRLERVGEFPFEGVLPEPIVFDNSSRFLASSSFSSFADPVAGGSIDFWRIVDRNPQPGRVELVKLKESIAVSRGPQSIAIVR